MEKNTNLDKRGFLKKAVGAAAVVATVPTLLSASNSSNGSFYDYGEKNVGSLEEAKSANGLSFNYPDADSPCQAMYIDGKVQAYSMLCTHKGCPTMYDPSTQVIKCPCHFSKFDAQKNGQMIIGHSTSSLPEILVKVVNGNVVAYGVNGLIFGREANKLG